MRARVVFGGAVLASALGAAAFGCVDLFHSTDFAESSEGGIVKSGGGNGDPDTDFCAWDESRAREIAIESCALLAACQTPVGSNQMSTCIADATLAYDCAAAPNRPVIGNAHAYWACLSGAKTCADISNCLYSDPPSLTRKSGAPTCGGAHLLRCSSSSYTRLDCETAGPPATGSSCLGEGQTCIDPTDGSKPDSIQLTCTGSTGYKCTKEGCNGTQLSYCADAGGGVLRDDGVDCANFATGQCVDSDAGGPACKAVATDAGACTPERGIRCQNDVAHGCASGVLETVNCAALGTNCIPDPDGKTWDVASACNAKSPSCISDTCSNGHLLSCVRGNVVDVDCKGLGLGLGECKEFITADGSRYACAPPSN